MDQPSPFVLTRAAGSSPPAQGNRLASFSPASYSGDSRTVEAVLSSGVGRPVAGIIEELDMSAGAMDLGRVQRGACPLLNAHNRFDVGAVLGVVEQVWIRDGQLIGLLRFADTIAGREAEGMVQRGELAAVSIGYTVSNWQRAGTNDQNEEVWRAMKWELFEVSLVPVPADPTALIRQQETEVIRSIASPSTVETTPATPSAPIQPEQQPAQPRAASINARAISAAARNAGLSQNEVDDLIERHEATPFTRDTLMAEVGRRFALRDTPAETVNRVDPYNTGQGSPDFLRGRMEDAIFARMSSTTPADRAREFMGASLANLARGLLEARGENVRWDSDYRIIERALHSTSDFPALLQTSGNRYLLQQFELVETPLKALGREREAPDFRTITGVRLSEAPALEQVGEGGEIRHGTFSETKESYALATFAKIFGITRQALINDDLGAFSDPLRLMARAAAETEAAGLVGLLTANSGNGVVMGDGKVMFHADHGNKAASGAALDADSLSNARQAMRDQKDVDGTTPINAVPRFIVVGSDNETAAEKVVATITPPTVDDVNVFASRLQIACDPRLPQTSWRLFADPAQHPAIVYAYLSGGKGPQLASKEGWDVLGMQFRVLLDFGCGVMDYRGAYLNPGA